MKTAKLISVWDNGLTVTSDCKVDTIAKIAFDIDLDAESGKTIKQMFMLRTLRRESVSFDGVEYPVEKIIDFLDDPKSVSLRF